MPISLLEVARVNRYELYHVKTALKFCIRKPNVTWILFELKFLREFWLVCINKAFHTAIQYAQIPSPGKIWHKYDQIILHRTPLMACNWSQTRAKHIYYYFQVIVLYGSSFMENTKAVYGKLRLNNYRRGRDVVTLSLLYVDKTWSLYRGSSNMYKNTDSPCINRQWPCFIYIADIFGTCRHLYNPTPVVSRICTDRQLCVYCCWFCKPVTTVSVYHCRLC